jgi:hypothetical protein
MARGTLAALLLIAVATMLGLAGPWREALASDPPQFRLGFKALADQVPRVVGTPIEDEHWGEGGDSLQQTSGGLMVWRKADNWTAFTNGSRTWVNGPYGVMERGNEERFEWEAQPEPAPPIFVDQTPSDYFLVRTEAIVALPDGSRLFQCTLANTNHYWTAGDIQVSVVLRNTDGRIVHEGRALASSTSLGPRQRDTWDYPLPASPGWEGAAGRVAFRWIQPGER